MIQRQCICFLDQEVCCIRHILISNNKFLHGIHNTYLANCCGGDWGSSYRDISASLKLVSSSHESNTGSIAVVEKSLPPMSASQLLGSSCSKSVCVAGKHNFRLSFSCFKQMLYICCTPCML